MIMAVEEMILKGQMQFDQIPTLTVEGRTFQRLDALHDRRYVSIFGELVIRRTVYGTRETQKHEVVPLDANLNLPDGDFSYYDSAMSYSF